MTEIVEASRKMEIRGPVPTSLPVSLDMARLSQANLFGRYGAASPTFGNSVPSHLQLSCDDKSRLFKFNMDQDTVRPSFPQQRCITGSPLLVADRAKDYFTYNTPIEDMHHADERAKAALVVERNASITLNNSGGVLKRLGISAAGLAIILVIGFVYYRRSH